MKKTAMYSSQLKARPKIDRKCSKCKHMKPLSEFWRDRTKPQGRIYKCKSCSSKRKTPFIETPKGTRRCSTCKQIKTFNEFYQNKNGLLGISYICRKCYNKKARSKRNHIFAEKFIPPSEWEGEEWRDVEGYCNRYQISKNGLVRSNLRYGIWKPIKPCKSSAGYLQVCLKNIDSKFKNTYIHKLMLITFVSSCPPNHQAAHLNGIKTDNRLANLAWVTVKENHYHKKLHGTQLMGSKCYNAKLTENDIPIIRKLWQNGLSQTKIAAKFGVDHSSISNIIRYKSWKHVK